MVRFVGVRDGFEEHLSYILERLHTVSVVWGFVRVLPLL